jgi:hypothetical protein
VFGIQPSLIYNEYDRKYHMTHVAIFPGATEHGLEFRAVAGDKQSVGRTAGEALDALTPQLSEENAGAVIILQAWRPDEFFDSQQRARLEELMRLWRTARDRAVAFAPQLQAELDSLTAAELKASELRTERILRKSTR